MSQASEIENKIRTFMLAELFRSEGDAADLTSDTALMETGILDSISTVRLIAYLETEFDIRVMPRDINQENLGCLAAIARYVQKKGK